MNENHMFRKIQSSCRALMQGSKHLIDLRLQLVILISVGNGVSTHERIEDQAWVSQPKVLASTWEVLVEPYLNRLSRSINYSF